MHKVSSIAGVVVTTVLVAALVGCGGSTRTSLTFQPGADVSAAARIVFRGGQWGGDGDIYVMNADGTHVAQLTDTSTIDEDYPAWSPDRTKIAFISDRDSANYELYTMNADGSGRQRVTHNSLKKNVGNPSWSPNGRRIAFTGIGASSWDIYTVKPDGGGLTILTSGFGTNREPSWSPDGTKIVYSSNAGSFDFQIWVMNADGSNPQQLTTFTADEGSGDKEPDWSPDGTSIVFDRWLGVANCPDLCRINADGSQLRRLTRTSTCEDRPCWSPSGARIAFWKSAVAPYNYRIFTMRPDGTDVQMLAGSGRPDDRHEDW
jgi:Tol biopolymer transport system component